MRTARLQLTQLSWIIVMAITLAFAAGMAARALSGGAVEQGTVPPITVSAQTQR